METYRGCKWLDKKKRKEKCGWTYSELQKMWRMANRENKLNQWSAVSFTEWRDGLFNIIYK